MWVKRGTSSANTAQTITVPAQLNRAHKILGFEVYIYAADAGNDITIELRENTTTLYKTIIGSGAPRGERVGLIFPKPLYAGVNAPVSLFIGGGGTGCVTEANIMGKTE